MRIANVRIGVLAVLVSRLAFAQAADAPVRPALAPPESMHLVDRPAHQLSVRKLVTGSIITAGGVVLLTTSIYRYSQISFSSPGETQVQQGNFALALGLAGTVLITAGLTFLFDSLGS